MFQQTHRNPTSHNKKTIIILLPDSSCPLVNQPFLSLKLCSCISCQSSVHSVNSEFLLLYFCNSTLTPVSGVHALCCIVILHLFVSCGNCHRGGFYFQYQSLKISISGTTAGGGSPDADYSLFLSENGHLSFENPNYQASLDQYYGRIV